MPTNPKVLFLDELNFLIRQSPAFKRLAKEQADLILQQIKDPDSPRTKAIYEILLEEQKQFFKIENDFMENSKKTMGNLNKEITSLTRGGLKDKSAGGDPKKGRNKEENAEDVLKNL